VNTQMGNTSTRSARRWDIDWLRLLATLLLFYIHPARIFYLWDPFYVKNDQLSALASWLSLFIDHWHMPLFFVLAGAASWFALRRRTGGQYALERLKRLLVPFIFGFLVIVPPQLYFAVRHQRPEYAESYLQFYPRFFDPGFTGGIDMGHLWYILYLFLFSLIALPLFLYLQRDSGQRVLGKVTGFLARPGMIFVPVILPMLAIAALPHFYPNPVYYIAYFILGYLLIADERFGKAIDRHKLIALVLGVVLFVAWMALVTSGVIHPDWLKPVRTGLIAWCCLIALLGYGRQFLNFANRFLAYFGEAGYPLYIIHQTVIVILGFYVVQWQVGVLVKLLTIMVGSFVLTIALYDLAVKRTNVTRFLFGMRPIQKKTPEASTARPEKAAG
jgi:glucan biosynthesis protein C